MLKPQRPGQRLEHLRSGRKPLGPARGGSSSERLFLDLGKLGDSSRRAPGRAAGPSTMGNVEYVARGPALPRVRRKSGQLRDCVDRLAHRCRSYGHADWEGSPGRPYVVVGRGTAGSRQERSLRYPHAGPVRMRVIAARAGHLTFGDPDWGWGSDEPDEARQIFDAYSDRGGNFIDTAPNVHQRHVRAAGRRASSRTACAERLVIATS